ncbi:hypothetical protein MH117_00295 [Paenibacillus sp. ACRRX]|uniref:hypothetical protein n=1 Tax=unclassified Paenibacillus TaxID=185978 RepID=UPI001EF483E3|nr:MULTISPECIES: hypothetical protein [unclassified Paenibacillus]MCG7405843.1 hypothetical protein [Paenibacillus sp. ACRRX]MDK8182290.1 hypothetical protein [Paenibacillus sp. UMB4589-SE434]
MNSTKRTKKYSRTQSRAISVISITAVLVMLFIALPTIPLNEGWSLAAVFGAVWALFAVLIIGAHLYRLLRVDEEVERKLRQVRTQRYKQIERRIMGNEQ